MQNYSLMGIQQICVGTSDIKALWKWYAEMFHFDVRVLEDESEVSLRQRYTGGKSLRRHACVTVNMQGGGALEMWQYTDRQPQAPLFETQVGDLGIFMVKIKSHNIQAYQEELSAKCDTVTPVVTDPRGLPTFYLFDPEGNCFQVVEDNTVFIDEGNFSGGVVGATIGVSDMEKAMTVYRDILGYDELVYDKQGAFQDWHTLAGGLQNYRRVLLRKLKQPEGQFSEFYGPSVIELVQALDRTPRNRYEGRLWGDPGFCEISFEAVNMRELEDYCRKKGHPYTIDSSMEQKHFRMGKASGHFAVIEDADGTLIEFVETHKLPLLPKLNILMDMTRRDRSKPISRFLFHLMRLNRVKFK